LQPRRNIRRVAEGVKQRPVPEQHQPGMGGEGGRGPWRCK
jgi:hypothetical protein